MDEEMSDSKVILYALSTCSHCKAVKSMLDRYDVEAEVIDVQSLVPLDLNHKMVESVIKTNRLLVIDEDVPGGASAYIMQHLLEDQGAYRYLDSQPQTLSARAHRPAYGTDGDYFSKPSIEDVFEKVYEIMREADPESFPALR